MGYIGKDVRRVMWNISEKHAQTAARFNDILAHVTFMGAGGKDSRLVPLWDQTRVWDPGD